VGVSGSTGNPLESATLNASYDSHDKRQENRATIGAGTIIIRSDPSQGLAGLNRDLARAQELTKNAETSVTVYIDTAAIKEVASGFEGTTGSFKALAKLVKESLPGSANNIDCKISYYEKLTRDGHSPEEAQKIIKELGLLVALDQSLYALADKFGGFDKVPAGELAALLDKAKTSTDIELAFNGDKAGVTVNPDALAKSQWLVYIGMLDRASEASGALTQLVHDYVCAKAYLLGDTSKKAEYERYNETIDGSLAAVKNFISHPVDGLTSTFNGWAAQIDAIVRAQNSGDADMSMRLLGGLMYDVGAAVTVARATGSGAFAIADSGLAKFIGGGLEEGLGLRVNYGPMNPGPLDAKIVSTFRSGTYSQIVTSEETILYRAYGGTAGELGQFWTTVKPTGPLQAQIDFALNPKWGNAADRVVEVRVPAGQVIYQGVAAAQGGLTGGGIQVFVKKIDPSWVVK
jgi:hypothetical protein